MLDPILETVRRRLPTVVDEEASFRRTAGDAASPRSLKAALSNPGLAVIAEVKRRSPSRGDIDRSLDPGALATSYEAGGAAAISVLTEPDHFAGSPGDLQQARAAVSLPVLRKDFMLHPAQIWESRVMGADAVLLIVAALDDPDLKELLAEAGDAGLDALVEVHTAEEAERAAAAGADLIGVNNRDLTTFEVDLGTAEALRGRLPDTAVTVAESGVSSPEGADRMARAGYDAILVGEAAVRAPNTSDFVASLVGS